MTLALKEPGSGIRTPVGGDVLIGWMSVGAAIWARSTCGHQRGGAVPARKAALGTRPAAPSPIVVPLRTF
jgi:hypothetical protein